MSSSWLQFSTPTPAWAQLNRLFSYPLHSRSSNQISPVPAVNLLPFEEHTARLLLQKLIALPSPIIRQATWASDISKPSLQTVPHWPRYRTSILPWYSFIPPTSRAFPLFLTCPKNGSKIDIYCKIYASYIVLYKANSIHSKAKFVIYFWTCYFDSDFESRSLGTWIGSPN